MKSEDMANYSGILNSDLSRRQFLNTAWLVAFGLAGLQGLGIVWRMLVPAGSRFVASEYFEIEDVKSFPKLGDEEAPVFVRTGRAHWVTTAKGVIVFRAYCTCNGCVTTWKPQESAFICPCCGSFFGRHGRVIRGCAKRSLDRLAVFALDSRSQKVLAQSNTHADPVVIPASARVFIDVRHPILGDPVPPDATPYHW